MSGTADTPGWGPPQGPARSLDAPGAGPGPAGSGPAGSDPAGLRDAADPDDVLWCRITGADAATLRDFARRSGADLGCRPVAQRTDAGLAARMELTRGALDATRASRADAGVAIEVLENLTRTQAARQAEVGVGDRFAERGAVPQGLGRAWTE